MNVSLASTDKGKALAGSCGRAAAATVGMFSSGSVAAPTYLGSAQRGRQGAGRRSASKIPGRRPSIPRRTVQPLPLNDRSREVDHAHGAVGGVAGAADAGGLVAVAEDV